MSAPSVSVIVPVYNDPVGIRTVLPALLCQSYPSEDYEVVIADNGSSDSTPGIARDYQMQHPNRIRIVVEDRIRSSYAARNRGIQTARGEILAFTDADCLPAQNWLENGMKALHESGAASAAGHVQMVFQEGGPNVFEYFDACVYLDQLEKVEKGGYGATANLFLWRELFDRYGLFRHDLRSGGDVEFGRRLTQAGEKIAYAPDAVVLHPARSTLHAYLVKEKRISLGHRQLRDLGLMDGFGITWRSFVPWARVPRLEGVSLTNWQKAGVRAVLISTKYLRLAYKLVPTRFVTRERPAEGQHP